MKRPDHIFTSSKLAEQSNESKADQKKRSEKSPAKKKSTSKETPRPTSGQQLFEAETKSSSVDKTDDQAGLHKSKAKPKTSKSAHKQTESDLVNQTPATEAETENLAEYQLDTDTLSEAEKRLVVENFLNQRSTEAGASAKEDELESVDFEHMVDQVFFESIRSRLYDGRAVDEDLFDDAYQEVSGQLPLTGISQGDGHIEADDDGLDYGIPTTTNSAVNPPLSQFNFYQARAEDWPGDISFSPTPDLPASKPGQSLIDPPSLLGAPSLASGNSPSHPDRLSPRPNRSAENKPPKQTLPRADIMTGGVVGYLVNQRKQQVKYKEQPVSLQEKLETQVEQLQQQIISREKKLRKLAAESQPQPGRPPKAESIRQPASGQSVNSSHDSQPSRGREQAMDAAIAQILAPEENDNPDIIHQEAAPVAIVEAGPTNQLEAKGPSQNLNQRLGGVVVPEVSSESKSAAPGKVKKPENMSKTELLASAKDIKVGNSSVFEYYKSGQITERDMRRAVIQGQKGGNYERIIHEAVSRLPVSPEIWRDQPASTVQSTQGDSPTRSNKAAAEQSPYLASQPTLAAKSRSASDSTPQSSAYLPEKNSITIGVTIAILVAVCIAWLLA